MEAVLKEQKGSPQSCPHGLIKAKALECANSDAGRQQVTLPALPTCPQKGVTKAGMAPGQAVSMCYVADGFPSTVSHLKMRSMNSPEKGPLLWRPWG